MVVSIYACIIEWCGLEREGETVKFSGLYRLLFKEEDIWPGAWCKIFNQSDDQWWVNDCKIS